MRLATDEDGFETYNAAFRLKEKMNNVAAPNVEERPACFTAKGVLQTE